SSRTLFTGAQAATSVAGVATVLALGASARQSEPGRGSDENVSRGEHLPALGRRSGGYDTAAA
ncbi:MAG: hypothetical protein JWM85_379, partial [Acidimicrobiaceae bacterium]|nr:hypothetical protein [Acidimicrobiaceae bacterium]